ncbi:MAG TPA: ATP-binding protein [Miltoncostaea sp.]|nr:ATP-binding protein [Miltoncostaea sp.]
MDELGRYALPPVAASEAQARRLLTSCLRPLAEAGALGAQTLADLQLMTSELMANAIVHGRSTEPIDLVIAADAGRVRIAVHDHGEGFDPGAVDPTMPAADQAGGRGLPLIHILSSDWGAARTGSMLVWCEVLLAAPAA